jgi:hypothetical protein
MPSIDYWEGAAVDLHEKHLDLFEDGRRLIMTNLLHDDAASELIALLEEALETAKGKSLDVLSLSAVPP